MGADLMGFTLIGEETTWSATLGLVLDEGKFSQSKKIPTFYFNLKTSDILISFSIYEFNISNIIILFFLMYMLPTPEGPWLVNKHTYIYKIHQIKLPVSCIEYSFVRKPERVGVSPHLLGESKFSFDFLVGEHFSANPPSFSSKNTRNDYSVHTKFLLFIFPD